MTEEKSEIRVRMYMPGDYQRVKQILEETGLYYQELDSEEHLATVTKRDPEAVLVAIEKGKVVGTVSVEDGRIPLIFRLAVTKERQRQGIGSQLMQEAENVLQLRGRKEISILVDDTNSELQDYYEKRGWGKGHAYRWMSKELKSVPNEPKGEVHYYEVLDDKGKVVGYNDHPKS